MHCSSVCERYFHITTNLRQPYFNLSQPGVMMMKKKKESCFMMTPGAASFSFRIDAALGVHMSCFNDDISSVVVE